jgi:hypothetical protein
MIVAQCRIVYAMKFCCSCATAGTGAVTLIQRFSSALNLHFHMTFWDGVYVDGATGSSPRFRLVKAPTGAELTI